MNALTFILLFLSGYLLGRNIKSRDLTTRFNDIECMIKNLHIDVDTKHKAISDRTENIETVQKYLVSKSINDNPSEKLAKIVKTSVKEAMQEQHTTDNFTS